MAKDFEQILDGFPTEFSLSHARQAGGEIVVILQFCVKGFGFGEIAIKQTEEGVFLDTEHMSLERVKEFFSAYLDSAITDVDRDPEKHRLYNRVMGSRCGEQCSVCYPKGAKRIPPDIEAYEDASRDMILEGLKKIR